MEVAVEYEYGQYLECEANGMIYILGGDEQVKWKLYRGLKRFVTGKLLNEIEEHVYGDDGIVIKIDGKPVKAKDIRILLLDNRESFLEQLRYTKGSMLFQYSESLQEDFSVVRKIDEFNDEVLRLELILQELYAEVFTSMRPLLKAVTYADLLKSSLGLAYFENGKEYPLEMMDVATIVDDYCDLLQQHILANQKLTWLWIKNPKAFMSQPILIKFTQRLRKICEDTGLLHVFILSDECLEITYNQEDLSNTVLVYQNQNQQLPDFETFVNSLERYYPDRFVFKQAELLKSLYRIFPYIGRESQFEIYLNPKDMILLKVVSKLLEANCEPKYPDLEVHLTNLEKKFLQNE